MTGVQRTTAPPDAQAQRARTSVLALFAINGFTYTNVVPWLPIIKDRLDLSNAALGTAIAAMPLGAALTGMVAGPLIARFGSGRVAVASGILAAWTLPVVALAPSWWVLATALFVLGCGDTWGDSAMNAHGLRVQRRYARTIINTFHAVWSIAAVAGGLLGVLMAGLGIPIVGHLTGVAVTLTLASLVAAQFLLGGAEHSERADGATTVRGRRWRLPSGALGLLMALSVLLMLSGAIEDAAASWGAVYMRDELSATAFLAGLPFVACQAMMTLGRLVGDRLTDAFGAVTVARSGLLLSAVGLGIALAGGGQMLTIVGFGLCGLGVAPLFPLALAAAGEIPGVRSGDGVTVVAWLARLGFLAFPPLIGAIGDLSSLRVGLLAVPVAGLVAACLAWSLRPRTAVPGRLPGDGSG
ncbi:MFS transporter [Nocardiopsis ansamitocini]|uniref:MFS transporter n=1 Tax=Nocardiopsis ansamitocini TaxID=1670832 RepID=A0A9W6P8H4_9ACTN|nr:MFS transporter [Nocardiopsis ansamitocini]GLU48952.1 MFS transporter [Nocardiopsis ansamitocini]